MAGPSKRKRTCEVAVVFDCNLFLQAIGRGKNHAYGCLKLVMEGKADLLMSEDCLREIDAVLRRPELREKFPMLSDERVDELIAWVREFAVFIEPVKHLFDYPTDPKDEPYINLAIATGAVFLVSWDKHIIRLRREDIPEGKDFKATFPQVTIMDPKEFLADFHSGRFTESNVGSIAARSKPLDPVAFRDACELLMQTAQAECEKDPAFRPVDYSPFFFVQHYGGTDEAISAAMRFFAFVDLLRKKSLTEFMRPADDGKREIHLAVFEAVAALPLDEQGKFNRVQFLEEVRLRAGVIDALNELFTDDA